MKKIKKIKKKPKVQPDIYDDKEKLFLKNPRVRDLYAMFFHRSEKDELLEEIGRLKEQVQTLQNEIKVHKATEETLKNDMTTQQNLHERLQHCFNFLVADSQKREKKLGKLLEEKTQENNELRRVQDETVESAKQCVMSDLTKHYEERMAKTQKRHEDIVKTKDTKYHNETKYLRDRIREYVMRDRNAVDELKNEIMVKEQQLKEEVESKKACKDQSDAKILRLKKHIDKQIKMIRELNHFSTMKETLKGNEIALRAKEKHITILQRSYKEISDALRQERDKSALILKNASELRQQIGYLEDKLHDEQQKAEDERSRLRKVVVAYANLRSTVSSLRTEGKISRQELKKVEAMVNSGHTLQQNIQHHLQACVDVIEQPHELRSTVMDMHKLYMDDRMIIDVDEEYEGHIRFLQKKLDRSEVVRKNLCRQIECLKKQKYKLRVEKCKVIGLLNKQTEELDQLKTDVPKATVVKRLGTWIKKKSNRVSPSSPISITDRPLSPKPSLPPSPPPPPPLLARRIYVKPRH